MFPSSLTPSGRRALLYILTFGAIAACTRVFWMFSLGNGDELLFSSAGGVAPPGQATYEQWGAFAWKVWAVLSGRTADWLSSFVYISSVSNGKWIASILAAGSSTLLAASLYRLHRVFHPETHLSLLFIPVTASAFAFLPAFDTVNGTANLTMYSAAVCNYTVPASLILFSVTLVVENSTTGSVLLGSFFGALAATMHEQAAIAMLLLSLIYLLRGASLQRLGVRVASVVIVAFGASVMFLSPGLHDKLGRVESEVVAVGPSLASKAANTFHAFGLYFPATGLLVSFAMIITFATMTSRVSARIRKIVIIAIAIENFVWAVLIVIHLLTRSDITFVLLALSTLFLFSTWLAIAALTTVPWQRVTFLLLLCAAVTFAIPAAAGLGGIRAYNYPLLFFIAILAWTVANVCAEQPALSLAKEPATSPRKLGLTLFGLVALFSAVGALKIGFTMTQNYAVGLADLQRQGEECRQSLCFAVDPPLPYPHAHSGYGEHDYAGIEAALLWVADR